MQPKRLTKGHNKVIAGVCSGFAEYFNIDPTIARLLFVALAFGAGSGILIYIICAIVMPDPA